jgi:hypothetical protein
MTGIQALERVHNTRPMKPGRVELQEFEYIHHGTQSLIANWHVALGKVITPQSVRLVQKPTSPRTLLRPLTPTRKLGGYSRSNRLNKPA